MKKSFLLVGLIGLIVCFASCEPKVPEVPDSTNKDTCLVAMLSYLPYEANQSATFIHDGDKAQWTITPYTGGSSNKEFPEIISEAYGDMWNNVIFAEFTVDGIGNLYRSQIAMNIYPQKDKYYVSILAELRFAVGSYYSGGITQLLEKDDFNAFMAADTIALPLETLSYDQPHPSETLPENSVAYLVKNKGLAEFSIDGGRTYWRLAE
jgi:hypothetical protein